MLKRILALTYARNLEFIRDRSSMGWNIFFPILLIAALTVIFSGNEKPLFKIAVISQQHSADNLKHVHPILNMNAIQVYLAIDQSTVIEKISRHQVDMLIDLTMTPPSAWVNAGSSKGQVLATLLQQNNLPKLAIEQIDGKKIRYSDWLAPGILGMNMMFSCLFGIGYVIVRYRKNGYLKRLQITPLTPMEFLVAQVLSRLLLIMVISIFVFSGINYFADLPMQGSYWLLFLVALIGAISMISMGLMVAARVSSEELAGGLLNLISWPMMIMSGVWFSMDGSPTYMQTLADFLPLTHMIKAARQIMFDGAGLAAISYPLGVLSLMTVVFIILGALLFKWSED